MNTPAKPALPEPTLLYESAGDGWDGGMKVYGYTAAQCRAAIAAAVAEAQSYKSAYEQLDKTCHDLTEKVIPNLREQLAEARAVPVLYQWQHRLGNPDVIEPFWTEWEVCTREQFEFALATPDYQGRALADVTMMPTPSPIAPAERVALSDEQIDALRGLDTDRRVRFYEHDFYVLSNFSAFRLIWRGNDFDTSEAAYHFEKFPDAPAVRGAIRHAGSAHEAFKIAESNKALRRPDWDEVKVGIMREILRAKVMQHEYVRRKLLQTGNRELVEDSWRDDFWGWGPNRDGQNMLGKLWMEVRAQLRAGITPSQGKETQG